VLWNGEETLAHRRVVDPGGAFVRRLMKLPTPNTQALDALAYHDPLDVGLIGTCRTYGPS
jgi:hypothetical protein